MRIYFALVPVATVTRPISVECIQWPTLVAMRALVQCSIAVAIGTEDVLTCEKPPKCTVGSDKFILLWLTGWIMLFRQHRNFFCGSSMIITASLSALLTFCMVSLVTVFCGANFL